MMADLGLQTYRFSISWSRVMPEGRGKVNAEGIAFYHHLVELLLDHDIVAVPDAVPLGPAAGARGHRRLPQPRHRQLVRRLRRADGQASTATRSRCGRRSTSRGATPTSVTPPASTRPGSPTRRPPSRSPTTSCSPTASRCRRCAPSATACQLGIVINPSNVRSEGIAAGARGPDVDHRRHPQPLVVRRHAEGRVPGRPAASAYGHLAEAVQPGDLETIAQPLDWMGINYYFDILVRGLAVGRGDAPACAPTRRSPARPRPTRRPVHTDMGWPITPEGFTDAARAAEERLPEHAADLHHRERVRLRRPGDRRALRTTRAGSSTSTCTCGRSRTRSTKASTCAGTTSGR